MKKYAFDQIIEDQTSKFQKIKKEDYLQSGQYKIVDQGKKFIAGFTNDKSLITTLSYPIIIFGDHTKIFKYIDFPLALGADGTKVLVIKNNMADSKYLYYYFRTLKLPDVGYSRHFKFLKQISIPIPEKFDDQIRIATVLSRVEALILKRKESIKLLDDILKNTFLNMFGDPVRNEKGWNRIPLSEVLLKIESGHSPICLDRPAKISEWGVLKLSAVTKCVFKPRENKALPENEKSNPANEIKKGDILFTRKNTYELVAACAYVWETPPKLLLSDLIFRFVPRDKQMINSIFLQALLSFSSKRKMIQKLAGGAAGSMPNISKSKLLEHKVEVPPLTLQNEFAAIVEKVELLKAKYAQSLTGMKNLYNSLSQRAFRGELDLSKIKVKIDIESKELQLQENSTLIPTIDNGFTELNIYSEAALLKIIQSMEGETFSFESLMTELVKASIQEVPKYGELKEQIYKLLEGENPSLKQILTEVKNEFGKDEKRIMLRSNI
ncbi:hypothetical protein BK124_27170 [Paenibacillus amylolyticus]|uniref:restriction endonuclease subunit S n=1 Tax=Paenibacillus amylolyticus TaxID=1451 RepID=UPI00096D08F7|nr:restriction endonuclease subunit S [Paenibacillus amylolyticus]OME91847.1 hypothetical protein BK124_27170 [Paenibacillus amylolyticus]OMF02759.1 hypothetical protein BK129_24020 [Paenibacillus amylolyticus]